MATLKKLINVFYPDDKTDSPIAIGTPIPVKFKASLERGLYTFINFALDCNIFNKTVVVDEKDETNGLNLFMSKPESKGRKDERCVVSGNISTCNDDFDISLDIETKQSVLAVFTVYVSEINGEKSDLIFRFDNEKDTDLTKEDLQQFVSRTLHVLF